MVCAVSWLDAIAACNFATVASSRSIENEGKRVFALTTLAPKIAALPAAAFITNLRRFINCPLPIFWLSQDCSQRPESPTEYSGPSRTQRRRPPSGFVPERSDRAYSRPRQGPV